MDTLVQKTQEWLNKTYGGRIGYSPLREDGITGWSTVKALTFALQVELGVSSPNGFFGPDTTEKFKAISPISMNSDSTKENINYIIQGALFCKGYNAQEFSGEFTILTQKAIMALQSDAGLSNPSGSVDLALMKALLSMDAFKLLNYDSYDGKDSIRKVQQYLNNTYSSNNDFSYNIGLVPCDGIYGRTTNKALIYALQIEEGVSADGIWGTNTKNNCPTIPSSKATKKFIYLLQAALYCNGEDPNGLDGGFGSGAQKAVKNFQSFAGLTADGYAGSQTWASLLVSTGDPFRAGNACDTTETITPAKAQVLLKNGRTYVGRYLTGKYKITPNELNTIYNSGLKIIPIMQVLGDYKGYFDETSGFNDANSALTVAKANGFPENTVIYFAIDYDALLSDLNDYILPYFKSINKVFNSVSPHYRVGVYAPRAICTALSEAGYTCSSYVSDMSTGFSSNLGYRLPENWSFDQIYEYTTKNGRALRNGNNYLEIDNVVSKPGNINYCTNINTNYEYDKLIEKINSSKLLKVLGISLSGLGKLVLFDNELIKLSVQAAIEFISADDDAVETLTLENGKISDVAIQTTLDQIKVGLGDDFSKQISADIEQLKWLKGGIKLSYTTNTVKIELSEQINTDEFPKLYERCPFPITLTLCVELKHTNGNSISEEANEIYNKVSSLTYQTVSIVANVTRVLKILALVALAIVVGAASISAICAAPEVAAGIIIFGLIGSLTYKLLNSSNNA